MEIFLSIYIHLVGLERCSRLGWVVLVFKKQEKSAILERQRPKENKWRRRLYFGVAYVLSAVVLPQWVRSVMFVLRVAVLAASASGAALTADAVFCALLRLRHFWAANTTSHDLACRA